MAELSLFPLDLASPRPKRMPLIIFAVSGPHCWYQLYPAFKSWWCGSDDVQPWKIHPRPVCPLPPALCLEWFDETGVLPVNAQTWEPEQYSPSARKGGRVEDMKVQKRPWVRQELDEIRLGRTD